MPRLEVTVGVTGTGKSEYARARAMGMDAVVVERSQLKIMLHGTMRNDGETGLHDYYDEIEDFMVLKALKRGLDVVYDWNNLKRENRTHWVAFGDWYKAHVSQDLVVVAVVFPVGDPIPITRAYLANNQARRGRSDQAKFHKSLEYVTRQIKMFKDEPVDKDIEGFDEIIHIKPKVFNATSRDPVRHDRQR